MAGVYCRSCEARSRRGAAPGEPAHPGSIWGADRISGLRCARCGALLDADDIVKMLLEKQSQLEQFGLLRPPTRDEAESRLPRMRALRVVRLETD